MEEVCYTVKPMVGQAITDRTGWIQRGNDGFLHVTVDHPLLLRLILLFSFSKFDRNLV